MSRYTEKIKELSFKNELMNEKIQFLQEQVLKYKEENQSLQIFHSMINKIVLHYDLYKYILKKGTLN